MSGARFAADPNWQHACGDGPIRVQIEKTGRDVVGLRVYVGGVWRPRSDATDLGEVSPQAASDWLLELAATAAGSVGKDAINAAVLVDAPDPWQRLHALARDRSPARGVRERAGYCAKFARMRVAISHSPSRLTSASS